MITPQPTPQPVQPNYAEKKFLHESEAAINVPIKQIFITSVFVSLFVLTISFMFRARHPFINAVYTLGIIPLVLWIYLQRRWLTLTAENILQRDLSGDGVIGSADRKAARIVKVQVSHVESDGHYHADLIDLPVTDQQLESLAIGFHQGVPFSERSWTGAGNSFSLSEFRELREAMIKRDLLKPKSEKDLRQGYTLTEAGQALMDQYSPPPSEKVS